MTDTITLYLGISKHGKSEWRWRYQAAGNNEKLAHGGEGYIDFLDCLGSALRVTGTMPTTGLTAASDGIYDLTRGNETLTLNISHRYEET
jgi:hypothetical protein